MSVWDNITAWLNAPPAGASPNPVFDARQGWEHTAYEGPQWEHEAVAEDDTGRAR